MEAVRKQLKVGLPPEQAFRLFTEGIGKWWPLRTHSVGLEDAQTCYFEGWVGGRIMEVLRDGSESEWGKVLVWKPFETVTFQWYPGRTPDTAQEVKVTFHEREEGGTLVELVHTGWETLGDRAGDTRAGYDSGWDFVLAKYIVQAVEG
ncbi:MAG: hypothetical protein DPW18_19975 [Chloroflexi bacterium]|nr:hypothetical protein [Chloroflexota bacterium]MDL1944574.1 hypothetical protein [Chloroflexi bacterium CFX2]